MKILHICLAGTVTDGWSYQENKLLKFHKKLGHDVYLITSIWMYDKEGNAFKSSLHEYVLDDGIKVTRLDIKNFDNLHSKFKRYSGLFEKIEKISPNIIFVHGCQFLDLSIVRKYAKKHRPVLYIDNHADFSNSAKSFFSKVFLHKIIWKREVRLIEPYVKKFYGVLPSRVNFLINIYKTPPEKTELLVMGGDDDLIIMGDNSKPETRKLFIESENDFLIVTCGKIDAYKKQVIGLMKIVKALKEHNVKLIIFGSVQNDIKEEFYSLVDRKQIQFYGWADEMMSYKIIAAADLVIFPGRHSIYWEQTASQGIPMVVKDWNGTHHIDCGGNVVFWKNDNYSDLKKIITDICCDKEMKLC